ncbi:hypothetical protein T265_09582 [Opisthorchis viverrini]|uniref:Uncharacterized protein n=1 Tax=Opisthorchis viverrini TaxID=6198 RepID=A0A074Z595_OPIVI|nr:hypothetical protein T265_09582 [Opisthorchis viverrini]KER22296.1 hypothetical protein T265_09582 [Opisthorchis viverrini]
MTWIVAIRPMPPLQMKVGDRNSVHSAQSWMILECIESNQRADKETLKTALDGESWEIHQHDVET